MCSASIIPSPAKTAGRFLPPGVSRRVRLSPYGNRDQSEIVWMAVDVRFAQRLLEVGAPPPLPSPAVGGGGSGKLGWDSREESRGLPGQARQ
jgi:hypothetical protein